MQESDLRILRIFSSPSEGQEHPRSLWMAEMEPARFSDLAGRLDATRAPILDFRFLLNANRSTILRAAEDHALILDVIHDHSVAFFKFTLEKLYR
jgi:hypothetical protein